MRYETCDTCGKVGLHEYQGEKTIIGDITTEAEEYICWECYAKKHNLN